MQVDGFSYSPREVALQIILRWHWLLLLGILGALVGWLVASTLPNSTRASTRVMVDHNIELALGGLSRPEEMHRYLNQETLRLEDLAYSETVWSAVGQRLTQQGYVEQSANISGLQEQVLLPHPEDGVWEFTSDVDDPEFAVALSETWASSFVDVTTAGVEHAQMAQAQTELAEQLADELAMVEASCALSSNGQTDSEAAQTQIDCPTALSQIRSSWESALALANQEAADSRGVSPYLSVFMLSGAADLERVGPDPGAWMLAGALLGLLVGIVVAIWLPTRTGAVMSRFGGRDAG